MSDQRDSLVHDLVRLGDVCRVFDADEWGGKDDTVNGNGRFYHPAEIVGLKPSQGWPGKQVATVRWLHNGRVTRGHFVDSMERIA